MNVAVLYGTADAIETRSVLVNGRGPAAWLPVDGEWAVIEPQEDGYETIVDRGSSWKFFDEYTDLGSDWFIDLNDSSWPEGDAELGYDVAAVGRPEATTTFDIKFYLWYKLLKMNRGKMVEIRVKFQDQKKRYFHSFREMQARMSFAKKWDKYWIEDEDALSRVQ